MKTILDKISVLIATGGGSGFAPKAPGTFGSLASLPFIWLFHRYSWDVRETLTALMILFAVGLWSVGRTENLWQTHDDSRIVIDEFAGMFVTLAWFPFDWFHVTVGFALFRLFDIWKPGPVGYIDEHAPGAWGTFFDDVIAGIFAALILYLLSSQLR